MKKNKIKMKILISTSLCVLLFSLVSNLFLYSYLSRIIFSKSAQLDRQYIQIIQKEMEQYISETSNLGLNCAFDPNITRALSLSGNDSVSDRHQLRIAQESLNTYLSASRNQEFVNRLIAFRPDGVLIESTNGMVTGSLDTEQQLRDSFLMKQLEQGKFDTIYRISPALSNHQEEVLTFLCTAVQIHTGAIVGYIYMEIDPKMILSQLHNSRQLDNIFVADAANHFFITAAPSLTQAAFNSSLPRDGETIRLDKNKYYVNALALSRFDLSIYSLSNIKPIGDENEKMFFVLAVILTTTICVGFMVAHIISNSITKPIQILINRIEKISHENDFSVDPQIEASKDEISEIGKVVNSMSGNINNLLKQTEEMYEQKKNIEMALLQSQINPHFLYNTLDSIRWMAVIQKSTSISDMILALEHLLRNVAKGTGEKITLQEEVSLLEDYIHIQSIRYVEVFQFCNQLPESLMQCKIVKFTLQPLVENAIFHGIVPTGRYGNIVLSGREENNRLSLIVEDDGAGMSQSAFTAFYQQGAASHKDSLSSMGIKNVDSRLKMVYGPKFGLTFESQEGYYTRVTIHIPKEE
ncbi:sensor histidine kinase [Lacrimispora celerecrescens]|uniref:sensor histidine kinase n=1 Tax=Lacrimispora celerecrescens TaxID=29354 RepID=UPI000691C033|nr:histidine kinase [Lacrimispora celerecrescens]